jgi:hypothetical protein
MLGNLVVDMKIGITQLFHIKLMFGIFLGLNLLPLVEIILGIEVDFGQQLPKKTFGFAWDSCRNLAIGIGLPMRVDVPIMLGFGLA